MRTRRTAIGRAVIVVVAIAVVIVVAIGVGSYFITGPHPIYCCTTTISTSSGVSTTQSLTTSTGSSTTYSTNSDSGLRLQVTLNSTSIRLHGGVAAQIELLNTLDHNVSLAVVTNQNISGWNGYDFFCSNNPSDSLVGFALFNGHFEAGNVSATGSPLQLAASSLAVPCAYSLPLNSTTFLPNSDKTMSSWYYAKTLQPPYPVTAEVNATTSYCVGSLLSGDCQGSSGILGYWNAGSGYGGNTSLNSKDFTYLPAGQYTIVAMDDWGQTVYAHFQVISGASSTSSVSYTTSTLPTQTVTAECSITGQPGPILFRILSDSNQTPVVGALVKATNQPAYCGSYPATEQATISFTTSAGTEWYSLDSQNNAGYSFVVTYLGQTYTFQASLRPLSVTCATLYVPSGRTNVTITEFQTSC